jgi:molybdate transport system permease protein
MEICMEEFIEFLRGLDWSPLLISLKTGIVATFFSFFLGIWAARKAVKAGPKTRAVLDGILTLPMVLPPILILMMQMKMLQMKMLQMRKL